jgi:hypothetical protein
VRELEEIVEELREGDSERGWAPHLDDLRLWPDASGAE